MCLNYPGTPSRTTSPVNGEYTVLKNEDLEERIGIATLYGLDGSGFEPRYRQ